METLVVTGVPPYDGRYPWDIAAVDFTTREWIWIYELAKVDPVDYAPALRRSNAALVIVLAAVMMRRAGKITAADVPQVWDRFQDVEFGAHLVVEPDPDEPDDDEADAAGAGDADDPPAESSSSNGSSSGSAGSTSSERSELTPPVSGSRRSDTSASVAATSAS